MSGHDRLRAFPDRRFRDAAGVISKAPDVADATGAADAVMARFELRSGDGIGATVVPEAKFGEVRSSDRVAPTSPAVVHRWPWARDAGSSGRPAKRWRRPVVDAGPLDAGPRSEAPTIVIAGGAPSDAGEADLLRMLVSAAETRLAELAHPSTGPVERPALSPRERECLHWTAAGKTTWEIAGILAISTNTVDGYIASATRKLGAVNRTQAAVVALRRGLID